MAKKGIDVSTWQNKIDWAKVKKAGIEFALIRAGYGRYENQIDDRFKENVNGAKAAGIPIGAYWYSYAKSASEAKQEANVFLKIIKGIKFEFPVYFDIEDNSQKDLGKNQLTEITKAFCSTVEAAGYYVGIYSSLSWLNNNLNMSALPYDVWVAQWNDVCQYSGNYGVWQYTSKGSVSGISGSVDMNMAYQDYPEIIKNAGLNGFTKPNDDNDDDYKKKYEELRTSAKKFISDVEKLV